MAGASGYAGGEILRLLLAHPQFEVGAVTAASSAGERLGRRPPAPRPARGPRARADDRSRRWPATTSSSSRCRTATRPRSPRSCPTTSSSSTAAPTSGSRRRGVDAFYDTTHAGTWPYGLPELPAAAAQRDGSPARRASPSRAATRPRSRSRSRPASPPAWSSPTTSSSWRRPGTSGAGKVAQAAPARQRGHGLDVALRRRRRAPAHARDRAEPRARPPASPSRSRSRRRSRRCRAASSRRARRGCAAASTPAPCARRGRRRMPTSRSSTLLPEGSWPSTGAVVGSNTSSPGRRRRAASAVSSSSRPSTTSPRARPAPPCSARTSPWARRDPRPADAGVAP